MIIGALPKDYQSVIDSAPPQFGIFYWSSGSSPSEKHYATITKKEGAFTYDYTPNDGKPVTTEYKRKEELIDRMNDDNRRFNESGKCVIEF